MSLDSLFKPRSIAVYGASATDSRKLGNTLLKNAAGGTGDVLAVHPEAETIDGIPAVAKLNRRIDLALISVPDKRVEAVVIDAAAAGAGTACSRIATATRSPTCPMPASRPWTRRRNASSPSSTNSASMTPS